MRCGRIAIIQMCLDITLWIPPHNSADVSEASGIHAFSSSRLLATRQIDSGLRSSFERCYGNDTSRKRFAVLGGTIMLISDRSIFDLECRQIAAIECWSPRFRRIMMRLGISRLAEPARNTSPASKESAPPFAIVPLRLLSGPSPLPITLSLHRNDREFMKPVHNSLATKNLHDQNQPAQLQETFPQGRGNLFCGRRHPQLRGDRTGVILSESERQARLAAVRGVFAAREGNFDAAAEFFLMAAREPLIDFGEVPGFWHLTRRAMQAAIDAYEEAGRLRDASAMTARIRIVFRPRPLRQPRLLPAHLPSRISSTGGR